MKNRFRRELLISFAIIGSAIVVVSAALFLLSEDLTSQAEKVVTDRALLQKRAAAIGSLADLKKSAPQAEVYKRAMDKVLVAQDQLLDVQRWVDDLARVRRVGETFSFQGSPVPPQENFPGYIVFSLDSNGSAVNLLDFIKDIEFRASRFLATLDSFDLTRSDSNYRILAGGKLHFK